MVAVGGFHVGKEVLQISIPKPACNVSAAAVTAVFEGEKG